MNKYEIIDRIIENSLRLSHLVRYYEKLQAGKPMSYEQECKLEVYFRVFKDQEELLEKIKVL